MYFFDLWLAGSSQLGFLAGRVLTIRRSWDSKSMILGGNSGVLPGVQNESKIDEDQRKSMQLDRIYENH